jgi:hypothetical protein
VLYEAEEGGPPNIWRPIGSTCPSCGGPLGASLVCQDEECALYGVTQEPFSGILHGWGKKVFGLVLADGEAAEAAGYAGAAYMGLFGYIRGAYIHDLTIELANTAEQTVSQQNIGVLAAYASNSRIADITLQAAEGAGLYIEGTQTHANTGGAGGAAGMTNGCVLRNITSSISIVSDIKTGIAQNLGGIAGRILASKISNAEMTGNITIDSMGSNLRVGGIVGYAPSANPANSLNNCNANINTFTIRTSASFTFSAGGIAGEIVELAGCAAVIGAFSVDDEGPISSTVTSNIGGLAGTGTIKNSHAQIDDKLIYTRLKTDGSAGKTIYIGGLVGNGAVSRSYIKNAATIDVTVKQNISGVNVGGLTGRGAVDNSFIGARSTPATITVKNVFTDKTYVGGLCGIATNNAAYKNNYAFCNVNLEITGGTGQSAGGLVGNPATNYSITNSYAAGSVIVKNNATEGTLAVTAGGIAGSAKTIEKCAALNGEVTITCNGDATVTKNWGRIASGGTTFTNNITTITKTTPDGHSITDCADTADGLFKDSVTQADFDTGGLGWDFTDVWEWDEESGYPVLKADIFEDQAQS